MNEKELNTLLERYYRGETTLDEEQQLRNALGDDSVEALLMKGLHEVDNDIEVPADLESSLSDLIDQWEANEQQEAKIAPSMWRRSTWWAAAASVAIIATVGIWFMRNQQHSQIGPQQPVIARIKKPSPPPVAITASPQAVTQPEQQHVTQPRSQADLKSKTQLEPMPSRRFSHEPKHMAQAQAKPKADLEPSVSEEEIALAALEKFSTTLNKGMDQLNGVDKKIENINNTIKQYL